MGKGEGVAYRGRIMMELSTTLGETPEESLTEIHPDSVQRLSKYLRRRKYRLHAAFLNASMVTSVDAPAEFEVSIGKLITFFMLCFLLHKIDDRIRITELYFN